MCTARRARHAELRRHPLHLRFGGAIEHHHILTAVVGGDELLTVRLPCANRLVQLDLLREHPDIPAKLLDGEVATLCGAVVGALGKEPIFEKEFRLALKALTSTDFERPGPRGFEPRKRAARCQRSKRCRPAALIDQSEWMISRRSSCTLDPKFDAGGPTGQWS